jgi:predicted dehydrogenase
MNLTPEQMAEGRRNFLKALAGTPALAALGVSAALRGPVPGGPVRLAFIGVGAQGRSLLGAVDPAYAQVLALCDINPNSLKQADAVLKRNSMPEARHYADWQEMLQKEHVEGVVMAPPLWAHADLAVGCLDAGKHVLCEKMMAWDVPSCERMRDASRRNRKVLEIGYQRTYNPMYQAAYDGIVKSGTLGDVYHVRLAWHRNGTWRRKGDPPSPDYDPSKWGYPTFDHLLNWRLYWKYSQGLMAELCSHQINAANWFLGSAPEAVVASGGVYRFPEGGREVFDHVYATFDYPGGRTAVFSSIESNAFDDYYEMYMGTKGTLIMLREREAMLFEEGSAANRATTVETTPRGAGAVAQSSETMTANTRQPSDGPSAAASSGQDRPRSTRLQIQRFCAAIRVGTPVACGMDKAFDSARACIRANEAIKQKARLAI